MDPIANPVRLYHKYGLTWEIFWYPEVDQNSEILIFWTRWKVLTAHDPIGTTYSGKQNTTASGLACQKWSSHLPHYSNVAAFFSEDHNYCRNPDLEDRPWCYTMNPSIRWEFCAVRNDSVGFKKRFLTLDAVQDTNRCLTLYCIAYNVIRNHRFKPVLAIIGQNNFNLYNECLVKDS